VRSRFGLLICGIFGFTCCILGCDQLLTASPCRASVTKLGQFLLKQLLDPDVPVLGGARSDDPVKLRLDRGSIAVLGV
jgi:hypothetical protein